MAETPRCASTSTCPLQSGSDRVLAAMHRGYTAERYLERLAAARAGIHDLAVSTDIIVGFPGETEDDFEATLEVAAEADFDAAFTFVYSPRPGTEAAEMFDRFVDHAVAVERMERLRRGRALVAASQRGPHRPHRGGHRRGAVEARPRRSSPAAPGRTSSSTSARPSRSAPAPTPPVEVTGAGLSSLRGELDRGRRRRRRTAPASR